MSFGKRLTQLRLKSNLSLEELSNKLNISETSLRFWERGRKCLSISRIIMLAKFFNVSVDYLLGVEKF